MIYLLEKKESKKMILSKIVNWYKLIGIEEICSEETHDFFISANKKEEALQQTVQATPSVSQNTTSVLLERTQSLAEQSSSLQELYNNINTHLSSFAPYKTASCTLLGSGISISPDVMVVLDMPNAIEDKSASLLKGKEGELLKRMLTASQLSEETNTYIAMFLPWRLPGDRILTPLEMKIGRILLEKQIFLIQPKSLFLMGSTASSLVSNENLLKIRGKIFDYHYHETRIPAIVSLHPKLVLSQPTYRSKSWEDWCLLKNYLNKN